MQEIRKCFKCGTTEGTIIKHHIDYNNEYIVDCCRSCHKLIHNSIRKNNLCPLSVKETEKRSLKSARKRCRVKWYVFNFYETLSQNILLFEQLYYNKLTGGIRLDSTFVGNNGIKIHSINK